MYLSRLILNPESDYVNSLINNPARMHVALQTGPFGSTRKERNVLYRLMREGNIYVLYVQSDVLPDWKTVTGKNIVLDGIRNVSGLMDCFDNENIFGFTIRANPCKRNENKIMPIMDTSLKLQWMKRCAEKYGFELLQCRETGMERHNVQKKDMRFVVCSTDFNGILKIKDKELFKKAFREGIGREKAYGCGLLMLSMAS